MIIRQWFLILSLVLVGCTVATPTVPAATPTILPSPQATASHTTTPVPTKATDTPLPVTATLAPATATLLPATATATAVPPTATAQPTITEVGPFSLVTLLPGELAGHLLFLTPTTDGRLFLGTAEGVWEWDGTVWQVYVADVGERQVLGMDAAANVWLYDADNNLVTAATQAGETAYPWDIPASRVIMPYLLLADPIKRLWLGTYEDVRYLENGVWTIRTFDELGLTLDPIMSDPSLQMMFAAASQTGWLTMCNWGGPGPAPGGGVRWFDGLTWSGVDSPAGEGCAVQAKEDDSGRVWIVTQTALHRYDPANSSWTRLDYPTPPESILDPNATYRTGTPTQFELDRETNAWLTFSLCGGASCGIPGFTYWLDTSDNWNLLFPEPVEFSLGRDAQGQLWSLSPQVAPLTSNDLGETLPINLTLTSADEAGNWWAIGTVDGFTGLWLYPAPGS
ncbi:MAG: hypothetical protein KA314_23790 [Chloroflexi bacterium]|nr:hypothetical protein [Chloroflexota bacterium]MBP8058867.1 hypothetical protein [Chloroflexota bacterium]